MNIFENSLEIINELYNEKSVEGLFKVLQKIIPFKSGYIQYLGSQKPKYSYNYGLESPFISADLKYQNTTFGHIVIAGKDFSVDEKKVFYSLAPVISNIIKDNEMSSIVKMQLNALQEAYEKIKEAEEIKSKFLSHVSHELRTPLNSILGFSELLPLAGDLNEKQKEYAEDIKVSGINLLGMINEILDMSKIEAGMITLNLKEFEILPVVTEVLNILKPLILKKKIIVINEADDFKICADRQKFQQILFNLLSNAIKFTPDNGQIIINSKLFDNKIQISVKDTGCGIPEKYQTKIFEKFTQIGDIQQNSTGLGLAITKELVKLHGWQISVQSKTNKGTTFIVEIS